MARVYYMCYLRGSLEFQSTTCRNHFGKTTFINFHAKWLVRQYIHQLLLVKQISCTPLKTNMSPENQWLEDVFPTEIVPFLGTC